MSYPVGGQRIAATRRVRPPRASGVRARIGSALVALLLVTGCGAKPTGMVVGYFRLPGRPAADLQRGGLNFSLGAHGNGHGETIRVGAGGKYAVTLVPGSYSVIGALSGQSGGPAAESCAAAMHVVATTISGWKYATSGTISTPAASVLCLAHSSYTFRAMSTAYWRTSSTSATKTLGNTYSANAVRSC